MLRNFTNASIKIHTEDLQSSVAFRISLDFFPTKTRKIIIDALSETALKCS